MKKKKEEKTPAPRKTVPDIQGLFSQALGYHREGKRAEAEACYRAILHLAPDNPDVNCNLAALVSAGGRLDEALECCRRALAGNPDHINTRLNLGNILKQQGRLDEALDEYEGIIARHPDNAQAHFNRGVILKMGGSIDEAAAAYRRSLAIDPGTVGAWYNLGIIMKDRGDIEEAVRCFRAAAARDPRNPPVQHLLAALTGRTTDAAPLKYVRDIYDAYAPGFDYHLTVNLGYRIPAVLRAMFESLPGNECRFGNAVDLGCGTGLAGVAFRPLSEHLCGIDISPKMIEKAEERGIYDLLITGDYVHYLQETDARYDLFTATDVFIYAGDLSPVFAAIGRAARPGAWVAFSTERCEGEGFTLRRTGRYAHASRYIRSRAGEYGFSVVGWRDEVIRREDETAIEGDVVILRRE